MKEIPLTNSPLKAIVDDEWYDYLMQWNWCVNGAGYATLCSLAKGRPQPPSDMMHRIINGTPKEASTDHINRLKLDNRGANLRTATKSQNGANMIRTKASSSKFKGVTLDKRYRVWKWQARIKVNYKDIQLGRFASERDAAIAYNIAALRFFGEFARLNTL